MTVRELMRSERPELHARASRELVGLVVTRERVGSRLHYETYWQLVSLKAVQDWGPYLIARAPEGVARSSSRIFVHASSDSSGPGATSTPVTPAMSARKIPMPTRGQQQQQPDGGGGGGRPSNAVGGVNAQAEGRTAGNGGGGGGAGTGQGGGGGGAGGGAWASSLDIVFSFSRSAAFFGENLPSGPSFVDSTKFQRPTGSANAASGGTGDGGTESGPSAGDSRRRRRRGGGEDSSTAHTTTDDDDDEEEDDSDEDVGEHSDDWAGAQGLDEAAIDSWEDHVGLPSQHSHEQLPSNAILPTTARRGRGPGRQTSRGTARPRIPSAVPRGAESSASSFDSSHNQLSRSMPSFSSQSNANSLLSPPQIGLGGAAQPGERTPLVSSQRSQRLSPTFAPTTRPPRFSRHLSDPLLAGGSPTKSRRLSIVSAELWQEALEETRGKSTWGQTLFNTSVLAWRFSC